MSQLFNLMRRRGEAPVVNYFAAGFEIGTWVWILPAMRERLDLDWTSFHWLLLSSAGGALVGAAAACQLIRLAGPGSLVILGHLAAAAMLFSLMSVASVPFAAGETFLFGAGVSISTISLGGEFIRKSTKSTLPAAFAGGGLVGVLLLSVLVVSGVPQVAPVSIILLVGLITVTLWYARVHMTGPSQAATTGMFRGARQAWSTYYGIAVVILLEGAIIGQWTVPEATQPLAHLATIALPPTFLFGLMLGRFIEPITTPAALNSRILVTCVGLTLVILTSSDIIKLGAFFIVGFGAANLLPFLASSSEKLMSMPSHRANLVLSLESTGVLVSASITSFMFDVVGWEIVFGVIAAALALIPWATPSLFHLQSPGDKPRIARIWRGRVAKNMADAYQSYLLANGINSIKRTALGVQVLREESESWSEFLTISWWESVEAMSRFAGSNPRKIHHLAKDDDFLIIPPTLQVLSNIDLDDFHYEGRRPAS